MANTWQQNLANSLTGNDGTSYVDGVLVDDETGEAVDDSNATVGNDGTVFSSNSGNGGSGDSNSGSGTLGGQTVSYTGTAGEGNFFAYDDTFIDPYQYLELVEGGYSDTAAFNMSYYSENETYDAGYDGDAEANSATEEEAAWYEQNQNTNISMEQYEMAKKVSKALSLVAGPIGLGSRAIIELQRRGLIPGNTATSWFENNEVPEETGNSNDAAILNLIDSGASDEEIEDAINGLVAEEEIEGIAAAVGAMANSAFGESNLTDVLKNPGEYFSSTKLQDIVPSIDAEATGTTIDKDNYSMEEGDELNVTTVETTETADDIEAATAQSYDVETVDDQLSKPEYVADAQIGTVSDKAQVTAEQIDMEATDKGLNAVGRALNDFAKVDISRVIDTSTVQGKLLADKLGEGNYVDSKSTILGQMEIISAEFKDADGNPKIPSWAQATARNVQKTIAFGGMSGTAATAALANAMMESTLGVAEKEAAFFQTLTVKNLDNRQEAIINKASVLANMELANLDARTQAAVQNAKAFLQMDLANLDNKQQTELLNTQARIDGLFEDAKAKNAERLFAAEQANEMAKFYDQLSAEVDMHRANSLNEMARFNAGETNDNAQFKAQLDQDREKFYKELAYNIDLSNAKWRQSVTLKEAEMEFDAAKIDVQNEFDLTTEALNRVWDREDAIFDYTWKSAETEQERLVDLYEVDKEYEVEMTKIANDVSYKEGQADWELFKWGWDLLDGDDLFDWW